MKAVLVVPAGNEFKDGQLRMASGGPDLAIHPPNWVKPAPTSVQVVKKRVQLLDNRSLHVKGRAGR